MKLAETFYQNVIYYSHLFQHKYTHTNASRFACSLEEHHYVRSCTTLILRHFICPLSFLPTCKQSQVLSFRPSKISTPAPGLLTIRDSMWLPLPIVLSPHTPSTHPLLMVPRWISKTHICTNCMMLIVTVLQELLSPMESILWNTRIFMIWHPLHPFQPHFIPPPSPPLPTADFSKVKLILF